MIDEQTPFILEPFEAATRCGVRKFETFRASADRHTGAWRGGGSRIGQFLRCTAAAQRALECREATSREGAIQQGASRPSIRSKVVLCWADVAENVASIATISV